MDKEIEKMLQNHFTRSKELSKKDWEKLSPYFEIGEHHIIQYKPGITDGQKNEVRGILKGHYEDYKNLEQELHSNLSNVKPKDAYNDFVICFFTQDIKSHVKTFTDVMIDISLHNDTTLRKSLPNGGSVTTDFGKSVSSIESARNLNVGQSVNDQKEFAHDLYTKKQFESMKNEIEKNCGDKMLTISHDDVNNNNTNLGKIKGAEIAFKN